MQGVRVQSLARELRSCTLCSVAKKKKKKFKNIKCHLGLRHFSVVQSVYTADNSMEVPQETKARTTI